MTTFLPGWEGALLVAYKWSPEQCDKEAVASDQVVYIISCQGFCTHNEWPYLEFQFTATNFMSMATKSSDLAEETSVASFQVDGQAEGPTQGVKDLQESEEDDISPSHLPLWSPARRPPSSCLNMKYCLQIQVTLTEELGPYPTFSLLDGPTGGRYVARSQSWAYQSSGDRPR